MFKEFKKLENPELCLEFFVQFNKVYGMEFEINDGKVVGCYVGGSCDADSIL